MAIENPHRSGGLTCWSTTQRDALWADSGRGTPSGAGCDVNVMGLLTHYSRFRHA